MDVLGEDGLGIDKSYPELRVANGRLARFGEGILFCDGACARLSGARVEARGAGKVMHLWVAEVWVLGKGRGGMVSIGRREKSCALANSGACKAAGDQGVRIERSGIEDLMIRAALI